VRSKSIDAAPKSRLAGVHLAPGVQLNQGKELHAEVVLLCPDGEVHLNRGAVAILYLCDGSRDRAAIVAEVVRRSHDTTRASDIGEFLDVALARGWIVEN
jgi:hypothetical protein